MSTTIPEQITAAREVALAYIKPAHPDNLSMSVHSFPAGPARFLCQYRLGEEDRYSTLDGWGDTAEIAMLALAVKHKRWQRDDTIRREVAARVEDISE